MLAASGGVEIVEGNGQFWGLNVEHPVVTNGDCGVYSCAQLRASMWYRGVDVANRRLSDWTRVQQRASPFFAVRGGDAALPKLL